MVKNPPANAGDVGSIPGQEDPLEEEMATHSSTLAWEIPWTEEPGRLQSMGSQRSPGGRNGNPLQYSCLENPMNRGACRARVHGIAKELDIN